MNHSGFRRALAVIALMPGAGTAEAATGGDCPVLQWTTLGTAGGPVPTVDRAEPSNLLTAGGQLVLVDTGDGTVNQLARLGIALGQARTVFISHHHSDHTGGLAAVIALRWMNQYPGELTVYGPPGTTELVAGIVASLEPQARIGFGLGKPPPPPAASVKVVELRDGATVALGQLSVRAAANSHFDHPGPRAPTEPLSLSYRFTMEGRSITYTGDTGPSAAVARLATGGDMLVSEVVDVEPLIADIRRARPDMPPQQVADMRQHLSTHHLSPQAIGDIAQVARVGQVVVTHYAIPGPLAASTMAIRAGIGRTYRGDVALASDLASFPVPCR